MRQLIEAYRKKRHQIRKRLRQFRSLQGSTDKEIFSELCFCLFTPGSKAVSCDQALQDIKKKDLLFTGNQRSISARLRGSVRFHNNKAGYLVSARRFFTKSKGLKIKDKLDRSDIFKTRDWLVANVKGLGYKEASHFLRNIGLGEKLAILDVHVLKNLHRYGVIKEIPPSMTRNRYLAIEDKMRSFAQRVRVGLDELDLLFWSSQTGFIFK